MLFINQYTFGGSTPPPVATPNIKYGALYNWYAASNPLFAPVGWHVPTQAEFEALLNSIDTYDVEEDWWPLAGGLLNETGLIYWNAPNSGASNFYNFNARGAGIRHDNIVFNFSAIKTLLQLWAVTSSNTTNAISLNTNNSDSIAGIAITSKKRGYSCRFIKDDSTLVSSLIDLDGNVYRTTKIGSQVWLADNWACTKLNNGDPIPNVTDDAAWAALTTGAYCWYDNDINNGFLP